MVATIFTTPHEHFPPVVDCRGAQAGETHREHNREILRSVESDGSQNFSGQLSSPKSYQVYTHMGRHSWAGGSVST